MISMRFAWRAAALAMAVLFAPLTAQAQNCNGQFGPGYICGNNSGTVQRPPSAVPAFSFGTPIQLVDNGSVQASALLVLKPATTGLSIATPYTDGMVISFIAPIDGAVLIQIQGNPGTYQIWNPEMTGLVKTSVGAPGWVSDLRKGTQYYLRYASNNPYGTGAVFQLISTPYTSVESNPPVTFSNIQDGNDGTSLFAAFQFRVFDTTKGSWKTESGGITQQLFNNTAYVDGVANQSLVLNRTYYVLAIVPSSPTGGTDGSDIKLDFVDRYFTNGATAAGACTGTVVGTALICNKGSTSGTLQTGQTTSCVGCPGGAYITSNTGALVTISSGTYNSANGIVTLTTSSSVTTFGAGDPIVVSGLTGTGAFASLDGTFAAATVSGTTVTYNAGAGLGASTITGGSVADKLHWSINRGTGTASSPIAITLLPAKYFGSNDGTNIFVDGQGYTGTLIGLYYVQSTTNNKFYANRAQALSVGRWPGNTMSNAYSTAYPFQPLTFYTDYNAPIVASTTSTGDVEVGDAGLSISSGTYNSGTGVVTLTLGSTATILSGSSIGVTGLTGTGAFASLQGSFIATSVSGSTVTYNAGGGLGAAAITGGTFNSNTRSIITTWEWTPDNPIWLTGYASTDTAGTCVTVRLLIFGLQQAPTVPEQVMASVPFCSAYANQKLPLSILQHWPLADNAYRLRAAISVDTSGVTGTVSLGMNGLTHY